MASSEGKAKTTLLTNEDENEFNAIFNQHKDHLELLPTGKLRCKYSKHEFPRTLQALKGYLGGKQRALKKGKSLEETADLSSLCPYLKACKTLGKVRCTLTKTVLKRDRQSIEKHVNGKSYQNKLKEREERKKKKEKKERRGSSESRGSRGRGWWRGCNGVDE